MTEDMVALYAVAEVTNRVVEACCGGRGGRLRGGGWCGVRICYGYNRWGVGGGELRGKELGKVSLKARMLVWVLVGWCRGNGWDFGGIRYC